MPIFTYQGLDGGAADVTGTIAADTPQQARDLLRQRGLVVRDLADYKPTGRAKTRPAPRGTRYKTTLFIRELSTLLGVGVPLLEALETIARQHDGRFQSSVLLLRDRVSAGSSLAGAMREQGEVFDDLCINITEVGEDAGSLDASLERLADFRERSQQLRGKVTTALIYPAIVLVLALFSSIFLMTFVVPRILEPLIEQGQELPLPTRIVKGISDFLLSWWWLLGLIGVGLMTLAGLFYRSRRGKLWCHRNVLRIPLLGELIVKQAIVRIVVVLETLLRSGIVFLRALEIAQRSTGNLVIRDALDRCGRAIAAGGDIGEALEQTRVFPPMVVQIFALGQQSGRLEEMLGRLGQTYDQQVASATTRMASILEPLLIVILAVIVLFIVMATVLPILQAGNAVS